MNCRWERGKKGQVSLSSCKKSWGPFDFFDITHHARARVAGNVDSVFHSRLFYFQLSVRNGEAGRSAPLWRLQSGLSSHA